MLTGDKQNEMRKKYFGLRAELITASTEYGDALYRRERQPSFWHTCNVATERMGNAREELDCFLAEYKVPEQERHLLIKGLWFTCCELAGARAAKEKFWYIEEKSVERQTAKDVLNAFVEGLIKEMK